MNKDAEMLLIDLISNLDNLDSYLRSRFDGLSYQDESAFRRLLKTLIDNGYLEIPAWGDNLPSGAFLTCEGREYKDIATNSENTLQHNKSADNPKVFISHRSEDKAVADMLTDFFAILGLPKKYVFCSSLPGNDVKNQISNEVKNALKQSVFNIIVLSDSYYESAYCLNEAGIIWYNDSIPAIAIALPEIKPENMIGFFNNEYKLRRLSNSNDVCAIYDQIAQIFKLDYSTEVVNVEVAKLLSKFTQYLNERKAEKRGAPQKEISLQLDGITDDENILLYYFAKNKIRMKNCQEIIDWAIKAEIHDVDVKNGLDLLQASEFGKFADDGEAFELEIQFFRKLSNFSNDQLASLKSIVHKHYRPSALVFKNMWTNNEFDEGDKLFIAYIIDEKMTTFGDRWLAEQQGADIKSWESKNSLNCDLSSVYGACLSKFIEKKFVYPSSWTSYGNAREYTLHESLKKFLFGNAFPYIKNLNDIKQKYFFELPF